MTEEQEREWRMDLAGRGPDCVEFIKIPDRLWGYKQKLESYIPCTKSDNEEEQLLGSL